MLAIFAGGVMWYPGNFAGLLQLYQNLPIPGLIPLTKFAIIFPFVWHTLTGFKHLFSDLAMKELFKISNYGKMLGAVAALSVVISVAMMTMV